MVNVRESTATKSCYVALKSSTNWHDVKINPVILVYKHSTCGLFSVERICNCFWTKIEVPNVDFVWLLCRNQHIS